MLHEPAIYPGVQQIKDKVMQYDPELYQGAQNLHLMSDYEKLDFIESQWGLIKKGFKAAKGYVNKNKGKWMKAAAGAAGKWYKKSGKKLLGKMLNKAGEWAKSKGIPAGLVDKAKAMAAKGADKGVAMGLKRAGGEEELLDLDNDPRLPVASMLVMLHEPAIYPGVQQIKDKVRQYDPELYQVAQNLHLMSDEEKWGWAKKMAKKGISAAKSYVNKNKGKWMKKAAGMAKNWYNKQGKKVLGKMLNKAGKWAKSKGIPAGLVDKAKAMAAKGADKGVAMGLKRAGRL